MVALIILLLVSSFYFVPKKNKLAIFLLFLLKLIVTIGVYFFFYYNPLEVGDSLRTSFQNEKLFDSNYYDYVSAQIAAKGLRDNIGLVYSTWNSFGVIIYISSIYVLLGINTLNVVICNVFIASLGILRFVESFNLTSNRSVIYVLVILLFMPYHIYYDATPSKESLTLGLFLLSLAQYNSKLNGLRKNQNILSLILLTAVRPMLGVLLFVWIQRKVFLTSTKSFIYSMLGSVLFIFLTPLILQVDILEYFNLSYVFALNDMAQERLNLIGIKLKIFELFGVKDLFSLIIWAPFRLGIWLMLPFPLLELPIGGLLSLTNTNWLNFFQSGQKVFRSLGVLYYLPYLALFLIRIKFFFRNELAMLTLFISVLISSYTFINSSRYRLIIEPLIIAQVITRKYDAKSYSSYYVA